tara:strand:+ start:73934 stop:74134 length:201 start_codon:yes stop_codon:yes gene_type:complete
MNEQARNINALLDKYNNTKQANKNKSELNNIKEELTKLMNNVTSVRDMFTNQYYLNDPNEDKRCAK